MHLYHTLFQRKQTAQDMYSRLEKIHLGAIQVLRNAMEVAVSAFLGKSVTKV